MKTDPVLRADGSVSSFRIPGSWFSFRPLYKILRSVAGVSDVRRNWFHRGELFNFTFHGEPFVVSQEWGQSDSSYSVGPKDAKTSKLDLTPVHEAFRSHPGGLIWRWMSDVRPGGATSDWWEAFVAAVFASTVYFFALSRLPGEYFPMVVALVAVLFAVVGCGLICFRFVRDSGSSKLRQWIQIGSVAIFAPLFASFIVTLFSI